MNVFRAKHNNTALLLKPVPLKETPQGTKKNPSLWGNVNTSLRIMGSRTKEIEGWLKYSLLTDRENEIRIFNY